MAHSEFRKWHRTYHRVCYNVTWYLLNKPLSANLQNYLRMRESFLIANEIVELEFFVQSFVDESPLTHHRLI